MKTSNKGKELGRWVFVLVSHTSCAPGGVRISRELILRWQKVEEGEAWRVGPTASVWSVRACAFPLDPRGPGDLGLDTSL